MSNQPPLNPDALRRAADELDADMSHCCCGMNGVMQCDYCMGAVESIVTAYLAAALPEVTSVEELDQLPVESVVMDKYGYVYLLDDDDDEFKWSRNGLDAHFPSWGIVLPARVLYRPSEQP